MNSLNKAKEAGKEKRQGRGGSTGVPSESKLNPDRNAILSSKSTATEVQIEKLIASLKRRPHHTHELRMCGISHPAGRVHDLVKRGYTIATARVTTVDSDSFEHVGVALYTLVGEPEGVA